MDQNMLIWDYSSRKRSKQSSRTSWKHLNVSPSLFAIKKLTCRKGSVINNVQGKKRCAFPLLFWSYLMDPTVLRQKGAINRDATYTNKQKQASTQTINHYPLSKLLLNLYFKWKKISQDGAFRTQATANEHLLNVSVCNGWKLEDLTECKQQICTFADFYLSNELRLSWKDKQDFSFGWYHTSEHVTCCCDRSST